MKEKTCALLIEHIKKYPEAQIQDVFKFLYQSAFGCEHMVYSLERAVNYIQEEYEGTVFENTFEIIELDGDYCRVPLNYMNIGLTAETLGKLFFLSAKKEEAGYENLIKKLEVAQTLVNENRLPFSKEAFEKEVALWREKGYPAVHHSEIFRKNYKPKYRLVSKKFIPFLNLFIEIDKHLKNGGLKMAIEGGSASGKTTLAHILENIYMCTVIHMDDFFLQPNQRTPERYAEIGGNVDRERFLAEILVPLSKGENINYRKFDCSTMKIGEEIKITPKKLTVIEGAYSMHPEFSKYYDFSVFLENDNQKTRIIDRNGLKLAQRFFDEWIPLENKYFLSFNIREKCSMVISVV